MQDLGLHRYPIMVMIITIRKDAQELIYLHYSPIFLGILYQLHASLKTYSIVTELIFRR